MHQLVRKLASTLSKAWGSGMPFFSTFQQRQPSLLVVITMRLTLLRLKVKREKYCIPCTQNAIGCIKRLLQGLMRMGELVIQSGQKCMSVQIAAKNSRIGKLRFKTNLKRKAKLLYAPIAGLRCTKVNAQSPLKHITMRRLVRLLRRANLSQFVLIMSFLANVIVRYLMTTIYQSSDRLTL